MADLEKADGQALSDGSTASVKGDGTVSDAVVTQSLTGRRIWLVVIGLNIGMMLTALDFNIVAPAVPKISTTLGRYDQAPWLGTAMLIAFAASLPLYAHIGDLLGHRNIFGASVLVFILGSGLCAGAKSMQWLIWARVVQGAGSGGIYGSVNVIITELVPLQRVGIYMSITQATWAMADVAGPLLGGVLTQHATWRWIFWINLLIAPWSLLMVGWLVGFRTGKPKIGQLYRRIDWIGLVTITGGSICLLLGVSWAGQQYPWRSVTIIGLLVGGSLLLVVFALSQQFVKHPLFALGHLGNRTVVCVIISEVFYGANLVTMIYYVPQFFVLAQKSSIVLGGVKLIPMMIGVGIGNVATGELVKRKGASRAASVAGAVLMCIFTGLVVRWTAGTTLAESLPILLMLGLGQGAVMTGLLMTAQAAVEPHEVGIVTGMCIYAQALGDVFGLAIFSMLYNTTLSRKLSHLAVSLAEFDVYARDAVVNNIDMQRQALIQHAVAGSMTNGWWLMLACALMTLVFTLCTRQYRFE